MTALPDAPNPERDLDTERRPASPPEPLLGAFTGPARLARRRHAAEPAR